MRHSSGVFQISQAGFSIHAKQAWAGGANPPREKRWAFPKLGHFMSFSDRTGSLKGHFTPNFESLQWTPCFIGFRIVVVHQLHYFGVVLK